MEIVDKIKVPNTCGDFCSCFKKPNCRHLSHLGCLSCPIIVCSQNDNDLISNYTPILSSDEYPPILARKFIRWWKGTVSKDLNLCDSCENYNSIPNCMPDGEDLQFGTGYGNDNINYCCNYSIKL